MTYVERAYPWLLAAPVLLPVVIWNEMLYPYLVPKTLLFYAFSLIAVAAFAVLAANNHSFFWGRLRRKESWIPAVLLALAYGASIFGAGFYHSFWSIFVRGDGLLMLTCAVAYFYLILLYADRDFFRYFCRAAAGVGTAVAVYGIGEWLIEGGRIGSLLGNAAFFAGYLAISFFATLIAAERLPRAWQRAAYVGAALQIIAILLTATRGTMLAFLLAGVVTLAYAAFRGAGKLRTVSGALLAALIIFGGLFFVFRGSLAQVSFQPIARIASIGTNDSDVSSRLFIWKNMTGEILQHPLLGVGAEHIDLLFNRFYDPTQISEEWFDRSHNAFLDYAAQYGIGGLLLYVALIGMFLIAALRFRKKKEMHLAALFVLLAVTYAAQNFFVFDTISSFWLMLVLLALALAVSDDHTTRERLELPHGAPYASWALAVILVLLIIPVSIQPARAAYDIAQAYHYQLTDVTKEVSYLSHGMALGTYADLEYGYEAYAMYTSVQAPALTGTDRADAYQAALSVLSTDFARYPYDARTALYLAHVLSLAPPGTAIDGKLFTDALARAQALSPKRSQTQYLLANLAISEANTHPAGSAERAAGYAKAKQILTDYIALVPTLSEPHFVLADLDRAKGDANGAAAEAALGKQYYRRDLATAQRAAGYYEGVHSWADAEFFLNEIVALSPTDTVSRYDLAKVAFLAGDYATAESIVALLRTDHPEILSTDPAFLAAFTSYEQSKH